ncbi:hypothetical protein D9757_009342 [Collybiopsis confluens]|uniref:Uncharacterized protein n=1 Tax=Collybiopsis confluens TaxID=2823264 RepID=A0A8H5H3B9_9AGAR|nr:hypothetical protein D9757_009342 [Collybiopsis confluens]
MPMIVTLDYAKADLIGALMECLAYGMYFNLFLRCMQIMRQKIATGQVPYNLLCVSIALFILITMRMVFDNIGVVTAYTAHPALPNAADIYFTAFSTASMLRTTPYIVLTLIADLFMVYRVYMVYGNSILAAVGPSMLAIADIVTGGLALRTLHELSVGANPDGPSITTHIMIFYSLTLALNVICTFLIALRIYLVKRQTEGLIGNFTSLNTTVVIIVESAAIYSASLVALIIPTALGSNVQFCILSIMPGVVGIAFSWIIIRVSSGSSTEFKSGRISVLRFNHGRSRVTATSGIDPGRSQVETGFDTEEGHIPLHLESESESRSHDTLGHSSGAERVSANEK